MIGQKGHAVTVDFLDGVGSNCCPAATVSPGGRGLLHQYLLARHTIPALKGKIVTFHVNQGVFLRKALHLIRTLIRKGGCAQKEEKQKHAKTSDCSSHLHRP